MTFHQRQIFKILRAIFQIKVSTHLTASELLALHLSTRWHSPIQRCRYDCFHSSHYLRRTWRVLAPATKPERTSRNVLSTAMSTPSRRWRQVSTWTASSSWPARRCAPKPCSASVTIRFWSPTWPRCSGSSSSASVGLATWARWRTASCRSTSPRSRPRHFSITGSCWFGWTLSLNR